MLKALIRGGSGTVTNVSGTANRITVSTGTTTPVIDISASYVGQSSITTVASNIALGGSPTTSTQSSGDNSTKISTTAFVTTAITNAIAGVNPAVAVQAATTQASDTSTLTYNNGVTGIGATLTGVANTALTIDGYTFTATGQRLLVKNDTQSPSGAFNGVYYVTQIQTAILPIILIRALDYDAPSDINNTGAIPVVNGTVNTTTQWVLTSQISTVGTDALTYVKFSSNPTSLLTTTLTGAHLLVGNGSNIATDVAVSGDVSLANTGAMTVGSIGGKAVSLANSFTTSGNFTLTLTTTSGTNVTLPTTGTLSTLAGSETLTNKTITSPSITGGTLDSTTIGSSTPCQMQGFRPVNTQTNTSYTLVLADAGKMVTMNNGSASTLTIPPHSSIAFVAQTEIDLFQLGAGQVTVTAGSGVTIISYTSKVKIAGQYAGATIKQTATQDTWLLIGNLA